MGCPISNSKSSTCESPGRGRRRRPSESSPLQVDVGSSDQFVDYSTFTYRRHKTIQQYDHYRHVRPAGSHSYSWGLFLSRTWHDLIKQTSYHSSSLHSTSSLLPLDPPQRNPSFGRTSDPSFNCQWKVFMVLLVALLLAFLHSFFQKDQYLAFQHRHYAAPKSEWDHNIYVSPYPSKSESLSSSTGGYLVAQLDGSASGLGILTDISSRPNRAYCRQHKMDYVRYQRGGRYHYTTQKSCFDKAILLNSIFDSKDGASFPSLFSLPPLVDYDAVALLPPDSIIMSLDSNVFDLLPKDKLVAIAGWKDKYTKSFAEDGGYGPFVSQTSVILFNLRHKHANAVAKLWWDWVASPDVSCGQGNDLSMLVEAISAVLEDGEDLSSVIAPLKEGGVGGVGLGSSGKEYMIKGIPPSTPQSRATLLLNHLEENQVSLVTTADSVCYRYYPQCEVL